MNVCLKLNLDTNLGIEFLGIVTQYGNSLKVQFFRAVDRLLRLVLLDTSRPTNSITPQIPVTFDIYPNINLSGH